MTDFQPYCSSRFKGSASSYAGQGVCSICRKTSASWMVVLSRISKAYCEACKEKRDSKEKAEGIAAMAHQTVGEGYSYWYGYICLRGDYQNKMKICKHTHKNERLALACARRMKAEHLK